MSSRETKANQPQRLPGRVYTLLVTSLATLLIALPLMRPSTNSWQRQAVVTHPEIQEPETAEQLVRDHVQSAAESVGLLANAKPETQLTAIQSKLETTTYIADAMYKVYGNEKSEIFVGGGLHIFDLSAELKGRAFVGEQEKTSSRAADDILAPLPNLRAQGFYALSPKWALVGTVGWFSLKYDDYDGSFTYIHARAAYRMTEHFGVALGYQFLDMDFSVDRSRGEAGFDIEFDGPSLHLTYSF